MNGSTMEDLGLASATDRTGSQPPDKEGADSSVLATDSDGLTGEPLDEGNCGLYGSCITGKGARPAGGCLASLCHDPGTQAECRSRAATSARG